MTKKPIIGITQGDFNSISMEVILKSLQDKRILELFTPVVYGNPYVFSYYKKVFVSLEIKEFKAKNIDSIKENNINFLVSDQNKYKITPGKITENAMQSAYNSIKKAVEDCKNSKIDAIVTAPINKTLVKTDKYNFIGHTDLLEKETGNVSLMTMISDNLKMASLTDHIPIKEVNKFLTPENLSNKIDIFLNTLKNDFGIRMPKVAILGLNPHASDNGKIGTEESKIIEPVIKSFLSKNNNVFGPFSSDAFFGNNLYTKYDGVFAMYHDQMLIPFKLINFDVGVNYTAGIPIIRTSPVHGTAMDIALKNKASYSSMRNAMYLACDIVNNKIKNTSYENN